MNSFIKSLTINTTGKTEDVQESSTMSNFTRVVSKRMVVSAFILLAIGSWVAMCYKYDMFLKEAITCSVIALTLLFVNIKTTFEQPTKSK